MRINITLLFIYATSVVLSGQNLVLNPGFEEHDSCVTAHRVDFFNGGHNWTRINPSTPDLFCSGGTPTDNGTPTNYQGTQIPHSGEAYSGLVTEFVTKDGDVCREYSIGRLSAPLQKDNWYYLEFYASLAEKSSYSMNRLGMKLLDEVSNISVSTCPAIGKAFYLTEPNIESLVSHLDTKNWYNVSGTYQALGGEQFLILGCFRASDKTIINYRSLHGGQSQGKYSSYYYFDDVRVVRIGVKLPDTIYLCPGDKYTLKAQVDTSLHAQLSWNTGQIGDELEVTRPGQYILSLNFDDVHINDTSEVLLLPDRLELGADTFGCSDEPLILHAPKGFDTYEWEDESSALTRVISKKGTYALTVTNKCGQFSDELVVDILDCSCQIYIPNVFTPNRDNQNDSFGPFVNCINPDILTFRFTVFNRWGGIVFDADAPTARWQPIEALPGVYTYVLNMQILRPDGEKEQITKSGTVALIR